MRHLQKYPFLASDFDAALCAIMHGFNATVRLNDCTVHDDGDCDELTFRLVQTK